MAVKKYGTISVVREGQLFLIKNMPGHVQIMFRRMFPRADPYRTDVMAIAPSPSVAADLKWFMARYPLKFTAKAKSLFNEKLQKFEENEEIRSSILDPDWKPDPSVGWKPSKAPYIYQSRAAALAVARGSLLLMDDVGLGKTISAFAAILQGAPRPVAIVVQPHLATQWQKRIAEFTTLRSFIIPGRSPVHLLPTDIYIFKYSNIAGWAGVFPEGLFKTVIYDEIQELRTGESAAKGKAALALSAAADVKIGLTATPIYNYGNEIFSICQYLDRQVLGEWIEFAIQWCVSDRRVQDPDALGDYLIDCGLALRRTEEDEEVDASLAPLNKITHQIPFDPDVAESELDVARKLAGLVLNGSFMQKGLAARKLDAVWRRITGVAKAPFVASYVRMLVESGEPVVLCGWHRDVYDIWMKELADLNPIMFTGSETAVKKTKAEQAFKTGKAKILIMSLRSGAGLDGLQHVCRNIVFGELDWSPQVHKQCWGRLRRPGQEDQVTAHFLHAEGGSDPAMIETLGIKSSQAQGIVNPGKAAPLTQSDGSRVIRLAQSFIEQYGAE